MGCDIHMVLEKQVKVRGLFRWVGVNAFPYVSGTIYRSDGAGHHTASGHVHWDVRGRNYDLFAALAGVRGPGPAARGVPDDVSDLAYLEIGVWGEDGHSHSWGLMTEVLPLFILHGAFGDPGAAVLQAMKGGTVHALNAYMENFWSLAHDDESLNDYRLVYWFDN
jgi:hypothetical protein